MIPHDLIIQSCNGQTYDADDLCFLILGPIEPNAVCLTHPSSEAATVHILATVHRAWRVPPRAIAGDQSDPNRECACGAMREMTGR